jgi:hypothetical protein
MSKFSYVPLNFIEKKKNDAAGNQITVLVHKITGEEWNSERKFKTLMLSGEGHYVVAETKEAKQAAKTFVKEVGETEDESIPFEAPSETKPAEAKKLPGGKKIV